MVAQPALTQIASAIAPIRHRPDQLKAFIDLSFERAATRAVLMSVYRTLKLRGLDLTKTIADALNPYLTTGQLPPLPA